MDTSTNSAPQLLRPGVKKVVLPKPKLPIPHQPPQSPPDLPKSLEDCISKIFELSNELNSVELKLFYIEKDLDLHEKKMLSSLNFKDLKEDSQAWVQMKSHLFELLKTEAELNSNRNQKMSEILELKQMKRLYFIKKVLSNKTL
eukprot:TRINITY_DN1924_c0_g1_i1.p1 TRINITY_DN1924_c0_g1~~TRINITY_DN1924_c0_g1_i1.p1  ORF type:complete len:144 (-),score=29.29 TRINITY_DN1924_c0_g1_i1:4-435(-)